MGCFENGTFWEWDVLRMGRFELWDVLCMGRFESGTFWEWDVLRVGRLVMGRFESGTFRDGTFCMFINISSSISFVIFPTFFSHSVSYLSPKYLISPPTPINVKPAVRGRLGIVKSLTVRYVKDWRMRRRVKTSEIVLLYSRAGHDFRCPLISPLCMGRFELWDV
jgi:hypothetical protein